MYNKIFTKILDSSIWLESMETRLVWVTFIAAMDEDGMCLFAAPENVARRAAVPLQACEDALRVLESPDPNSADKDFEGRRIQRVPGGWVVLNADKYRNMVTRAVVQEQTRERVRRFRERMKGNATVTPVTSRNAKVTKRNETVTTSETEAESKSDTEPRERGRIADASTALSLPDPVEIDRLDADIADEEKRFNSLALPIRDEIQSVLDALPRPKDRSPFSATRWLRTGMTGIPRSAGGLTVLRLINDALEARQRANGAAYENPNRRAGFDSIDRVIAAAEQQPFKQIGGKA